MNHHRSFAVICGLSFWMIVHQSFRKYGSFKVGVDSTESLLFDRAEEFNALSEGIPFRETTWLRPWFKHLGKSQTTCFITVIDDDDRIRGVLPLERFGSRGWQWVGAGLCTDHTSVITREADREPVTRCIGEFLLKNVADPELGWDRLHFDGVVAGDPGMDLLLQQLGDANNIRLQSRTNVWFRSCTEGWESYLQGASRRQRRRHRTALRLLEETELPLEVRFAEDASSVAHYVSELIRLHQKHWRSQGQPGSYSKPGTRDFIQESTLEALERGRLLMPALFRTDPDTGEERIIAVQIHFVGDDQRMYCYSVGMDYDYADIKPGNLLNSFLLRMAHDGMHPGIDLMRGDEEYKKRMSADPVPLLIADVFAPTLCGQLDRLGHDFSLRVKQFYRQRRGRPLAHQLQHDEAFAKGYQAFLPNHAKGNSQINDPAANKAGITSDIGSHDESSSSEEPIDEGPILLPFGNFLADPVHPLSP